MDIMWRNKRSMVNTCLIILIGILSHQALSAQASYQDQKSSGNDDEGSGSANYNFKYAVNEEDGGNDFGHEEERNGHETRGRYQVLLPDGRLQIVTYTADKNGYKAEVTYENRGGGSGGGGEYSAPKRSENTHPSKSYTPPPAESSGGYSSGPSSSSSGTGSSYGKRTGGRSFVKVRRNDIKGGNYNYSF